MQTIIERCKGLILKPTDEFTAIKGETMTIALIYKNYLLILAAIPAVASFIGLSLIGASGFGYAFRYPVSYSLTYSIATYILTLLGIYALGMVIDALAPNFNCSKDFNGAIKIAAFSCIPAFIAGIFMIIPALSVLAIIGSIYSLYLLFIGIKVIKEPPQDKVIAYTVVAIVILIVIYFLIGSLSRSLVFRGITPGLY